MKTEWKQDRLMLTPENQQEKDSFAKIFPKGPTGTRRIRVKEFVDKFGHGTNEHYLEVVGKKGEANGIS